MKKRMVQIGKKTGLEAKEVNNLTKIGISGLLALCFSAFTGIVTANAADPVRPPDNIPPGPMTPETKCRVTPKASHCKGLFTTYYFDSKTNTCMKAQGCVTSVFDSKKECEKACIGTYPVSKYGGVGLRDFDNAE